MKDDSPTTPRLTDRAEAARVARHAREAEALRANLRRRKQQARTRAQDDIAAQPANGPTPGSDETTAG
jgi:hypothetical protein